MNNTLSILSKNVENFIYKKELIDNILKDMILSASGWRKIFTHNNDENSNNEDIGCTNSIISIVVATSFVQFMKEKSQSNNPCIVIGRDSRPTGEAIEQVINSVFTDLGVITKNLGIVGAPEIISYAQQSKECDGFIYVSASHNPIGHNGFKFGLSANGVLNGDNSTKLIERFINIISNKKTMDTVISNFINTFTNNIDEYKKEISKWKNKSEETYLNFSKTIISGFDSIEKKETSLNKIKSAIKDRPISILAEYNGSARCVGIDKKLIESMGIGYKALNDIPGQIVHQILPEGNALDLCASELEKAYQKDSSFILGFVPDCDGDRGNIVYIDEESGKANILQAQEVFALCVLAELSFIEYADMIELNSKGAPKKLVATVVNGPTSMRIDLICSLFGTKLFRAEVGESNVTSLAEDVRENGYIVRILGEGSNGGNITYPSSVRDPINTLFSFVKLLTIRTTEDKQGLFDRWLSLINKENRVKVNFCISDIVKTLPNFITTEGSSSESILKIKGKNQAILKFEYEKIFLNDWDNSKNQLKKEFGIHNFKVINYEGKKEKVGIGKKYRSGKEDGGFKLIFEDNNGELTSFIWMRGSKTEPLFRVIADVKGNNASYHDFLLKWHTKTLKEADKLAYNRENNLSK